MTTTKKLSLILLIAAIAVVLWYAINFPNNQPPVVIETPIENATTTEEVNNATTTEPIVVATSTKGWLTYRNEEYGFELKFPSGWNLNENSWVQSGNEQNYVMILNSDDYSYLIIDKIDKEKITINKDMNVIILDNITIGGYKTEIAYIENGLNQDFFYRYFLRTNKENLQIYFVPGKNEETNKSIFYHIINTIKFD